MPKISLLILIFIILTALSINFNPHQQNNSPVKIDQNNIQALNQQHASKKINPSNPNIQKYFFKVAEVPYKANYNSSVPKTPSRFWKDNSGDCDDKSVAFANYLHQMGAEDIKLVTITHESKEYAHSAVMWQNHIFDASADPPIYNMNRSTYYDFAQKKGFKLWVEYTYSHSNGSDLKNQSVNKSVQEPAGAKNVENTLQTYNTSQAP